MLDIDNSVIKHIQTDIITTKYQKPFGLNMPEHRVAIYHGIPQNIALHLPANNLMFEQSPVLEFYIVAAENISSNFLFKTITQLKIPNM